MFTAYVKNATNAPAVISPSITLLPPNHKIIVTPIAATNSMVGVKVAESLTYFICARKLCIFCASKRSSSYASLTKDLITRAEDTTSCNIDVKSAVAP